MPSKSVGGFDLVLGGLYNDYWFNAAELQHNSHYYCEKCQSATTVHQLEKYVFAFGKITIKYCTVLTCPDCLHERVINSPKKDATKPATKTNLVKLFSKLSKSVQQQLLLDRR